jgi:acyl-coenzyme A thioesterase PaaI-like protein
LRKASRVRIGGTRDYRMTTTTDSVLKNGVAGHGDELRLTLDPRFQGLPGAAHGGTVLAAFQAVAGIAGGQQVRGVYRKRVPLGAPMRLTVARRDGAVACRLFDETDTMLVEGGVAPVADAPTAATAPRAGGDPLPVSSTCFACGVDNALGLQARLQFDEASVGVRWTPRETAAAADGALAPIALTALLDEAAFWLGALASGEAGMTTELAVTLHGPVPFGVPIVVAGARGHTRPHEDGRFWETEVTAADVSGRLVASGRITFVAVRGAARRLVEGLLARNSRDLLARVFPAYAR